MSAFVVEDSTINKIVSYLYFNQAGDDPTLHSFPLFERKQQWKLAHKLFALNVRGVRAKHPDMDYGGIRFRFAVCRPESKIKTYKALQCSLYQACEGDVPDSKLYIKMQMVYNSLAHSIIYDLPEYDKAAWE